MKKSKFFMCLLFLGLLLIGCSNKETGESGSHVYESAVVTINNSTQINYAPIYFAEAEGYFEEFGIELEVLSVSRLPESIPLLLSGQMDVYAGSNSSGLINIFAQEPNIKAVVNRGQIEQGDCSMLAILIRKDLYESGAVTGPEDLAGLTIATSISAARGFYLHTYLKQGGLNLDDVMISDIPSSAYIDAFKNKTVDAIVTPELNLTRVLQSGNAAVLSRAEDVIGPYLVSVLAFGPRLIRDDPDLGVRFLAAYLKGVMAYSEGKTEHNLSLLSEVTGENKELLSEACWMPIREDGWIDFSYVDPFQQWSLEVDQLDEAISEEQYWDPSFLENAKALLNH